MTGGLVFRDVLRALKSGAWVPIAFFLIVVVLIPLGIGPDPALLRTIGPSVIWVAALLASLMPVDRLINPDLEDGVIDQLVVRGMSEEALAFAKIAAHWLAFAPLLGIACFPAAALLGFDSLPLGNLLVSLLVGTPALAGLAVAVAALTAGLPRTGALAGLVALPLAVPLLIFGSAAAQGDPAGLKFEIAVALLVMAGSPFVAGAAIRAART